MISFKCKIVSSQVKEDKKTQDHIILTKLTGVGIAGMFKEFSSELDSLLFATGQWVKISTGCQMGMYTVNISDIVSKQSIAEVKDCVIKDIKAKFKDGVIELAIIIKHKLTTYQKHLETSIPTEVEVKFEIQKEDIKTE
jgi:hypothetical protein